jgi:chorismate synthase
VAGASASACGCAAIWRSWARSCRAGFDWSAVEDNPFFWPDAAQVPELESYMDALRKSGDSVGARVTVVADGVPPGWGEPIYGKLDGDLAAADEHQCGQGRGDRRRLRRGRSKGTEHRDEITPEGFPEQPRRRHPRRHFHRAAGGLLDRVQADLQPAPAGATAWTTDGNRSKWSPPAATTPAWASAPRPIAEAMVALVLMDQALRHRAQCGDVGEVVAAHSARLIGIGHRGLRARAGTR